MNFMSQLAYITHLMSWKVIHLMHKFVFFEVKKLEFDGVKMLKIIFWKLERLELVVKNK